MLCRRAIKPLGFGFDVNIHPGACLATAVRQLGFLQVATAHVGDINERNPPQHKKAAENRQRGVVQIRRRGYGGLQTAQSTFTQSPFHIDPRAGIDPAEQPRLERSFSFINGPVIHGPDDAHVGGNGIPAQPAPQKIGLESLKPQRIDFLKVK